MDATRYVDWPNNLTRSELVALLRGYATEARDVEHILAIALGFPIDYDGEVGPAGLPVLGEHTALTLAIAAAKRLGELDPLHAAECRCGDQYHHHPTEAT